MSSLWEIWDRRWGAGGVSAWFIWQGLAHMALINEADLRRALAAGEIVAFFQELVDLRSGATYGYEALARWIRPHGCVEMPVNFIPLAVACDLIEPLTETIFAQSCRAALTWPDHLLLSMNLDPGQLASPDLPGRLAGIAEQEGLPLRRVLFEITETGSIENYAVARAVCEDLRLRGARIALDDFGMGRSNLNLVQELPLDTIKIDASFALEVLNQPRNRAIVANIVALARDLKMTIIAEGIENPAQAGVAEALGCHIGQGWFFGRPAPHHQPVVRRAAPTWRDEGDNALSSIPEDAGMFDLAPISLWLQDFSEVRMQLVGWAAAGVSDLRAYLEADPQRVFDCVRRVRLIKVNQRTLTLFEANNLQHLRANTDRIFCTNTTRETIDSLVSLWDGNRGFVYRAVDYTIGGRRLEVQLHGSILPGHEQSWDRVLIAVEDVTNLENLRNHLVRSEAYARSLFDHAPMALWVKDFSRAKRMLDDLRAGGIVDLRAFAREHPDFMRGCVDAVRVLDVNHRAATLLNMSDDMLRGGCRQDLLRVEADMSEQLFGLWAGALFQERESLCHRPDGTDVCVQLQLSVLPGYEQDWARVQVARLDLTARQQAENRLLHLQTYDSLTGMHTRSFYSDAINRFDVAVDKQVTIIIIDVNGLKRVNDRFGHAEGDEMLRQVGVFLGRVCRPPVFACRIGGDEFAILLPDADEQQGRQFIEMVEESLECSNLAHDSYKLSLSFGLATRRRAEPLATTARRADSEMYIAKRRYYARREDDLRFDPLDAGRPDTLDC